MTTAFNLKDAIVEALAALGGSGTVAEVREYLKSKFGKEWKNIDAIMDDLSVESASSFFPPEDRVLRQTRNGKYSLKELVTEPPETEILAEEPKPKASEPVHSMIESTVALYSEKLKQILNQPILKFSEATSKQVPETSGVYIIHDESSNQIIYAGRSRNLGLRLLQQHKRGNIEGSQFRKTLGHKLNLTNELRISEHILANCSFQFLAVANFEERVRLEHFVTAILAPTLNTELKQ